MRTLLLTLTTCLLVLPVQAKYSGGSGTAQDPYQIATAADLILLGQTPTDYGKHFLLAADIDLDPNLPGRKVFDKAVIAPDTDLTKSDFQGTPFTGVFDGDGHTISHLTIMGKDNIGLFGKLDLGGVVAGIVLLHVNISGSGGSVGGLAGESSGDVSQCFVAGSVSGDFSVGGMVGLDRGSVTQSCSAGAVAGQAWVGGLAGTNWGTLAQSYSHAVVRGGAAWIGGLAGWNGDAIIQCYSIGTVSGTFNVGGLAGSNLGGTVTASFWDTRTSGLATSAGGTGKTTSQMQTAATFLQAGWDFVGETANGSKDIWRIDEGKDYPRLWWEGLRVKYGGGTGTVDDPYQIWTAEQMNAIGANIADWSKHFKLMADIDLSGFDGKNGRPAFNLIGPDTNRTTWYYDGIPFIGVFDGNGHTVSHLTISGQSYLGLFCYLDSGAEVRNLGVVDVNISGADSYVGGLVGYNLGSLVTQCYSTGVVTAGQVHTGGLVGYNRGTVTHCWSAVAASGGGLVGGLAGDNWGTITGCYGTGAATGTGWYGQVGGLIGGNWATVTGCYSMGPVSSPAETGGLIGVGGGRTGGAVTGCFWDTQTSGQAASAGGTGKTTAEMQTARTFLYAGWDFVGETANGSKDIWWILEGKNYPKLWWELPAAK